MTWSKTLLFFFKLKQFKIIVLAKKRLVTVWKNIFEYGEAAFHIGWSYRAKLQTSCFICRVANGKLRTFPSQNLADVIEGFKTADFFKDTSHFLLEDLSLGAKDALNSILCSIDDSESLIQRQTGLLESLDLQLWTQKTNEKVKISQKMSKIF